MGHPMIKLGVCCKVVSGATPRTDVAEYWDGNILWVTPKDIANLDDPILMDTPDKITEVGFKNCSTQMLPAGAILLSSRAPIGHVAIAGHSMCTNQGFKSLVPGKGVDTTYLYHCMKYYAPRLAELGNGATFKEVSKPIVENFEIPLPIDISVQASIAAILDKADAIRKKRRTALNLADEFLCSTFLDMFGDPMTNPKGWRKEKLGSVTTKIGSGATPLGGDSVYQTSGISFIRSLNVHDRHFLMKDLAYLDDQQAARLSNVKVLSGDLLLNITGASVARSCLVPEAVLPARVNQHVSIIRSDGSLVPEFLEAQIVSESVKKKLLGIGESMGATRQAITKAQLESFEVIVPPLQKQNRFAEIVFRVSQQKQSMLAFQDQADQLFYSLQHQAFA